MARAGAPVELIPAVGMLRKNMKKPSQAATLTRVTRIAWAGLEPATPALQGAPVRCGRGRGEAEPRTHIGPTTGVGSRRLVVVPSPSSPVPLSPQQ
jgi:hypothetical protein